MSITHIAYFIAIIIFLSWMLFGEFYAMAKYNTVLGFITLVYLGLWSWSVYILYTLIALHVTVTLS